MTKKVFMTTEYKNITDINNPFYGKTRKEAQELVNEETFLLYSILNTLGLRYIKTQTLEICKWAIKQDTAALQDVDAQFYQELGIELLKEQRLVMGAGWKLFYYQGKYVAGCRGPWTSEEALEHWSEFHLNQERATLFREAIVEHQKQLNKIA
jgi:hypothetical protein